MSVLSPDIEEESRTQIVFGEKYADSQLKLLELSPSLLKALESGEEVAFVGGEEETVVICTEKETFEVRNVETSNMQLLLPPQSKTDPVSGDGSLKSEVFCCVSAHMECKAVAPRVISLKTLLSQRLYCGEEGETEAESEVFPSWPDLLQSAQCSPAQLRSTLEQLGAVELNGTWRLVDPKVRAESFRAILQLVCEFETPLDSVSLAEVVRELPEDDPVILEHALRTFGAVSEGNPDLFCLDPRKVSRFCGVELLRESKHVHGMPEEELLLQWSNLLPVGIAPDVDLLKGFALTEMIGGNPVYRLFLVDDLSPTLPTRMGQLFDVRANWLLEDISPYLCDFLGPGVTEGDLLLKYARTVLDPQTGVSTYCARG